MTEQTKHPSLLAQELVDSAEQIKQCLTPEGEDLPCQNRISQWAAVIIETIIDVRIAKIDKLLKDDCFGFEDHLTKIRVCYAEQRRLLVTITSMPS